MPPNIQCICRFCPDFKSVSSIMIKSKVSKGCFFFPCSCLNELNKMLNDKQEKYEASLNQFVTICKS